MFDLMNATSADQSSTPTFTTLPIDSIPLVSNVEFENGSLVNKSNSSYTSNTAITFATAFSNDPSITTVDNLWNSSVTSSITYTIIPTTTISKNSIVLLEAPEQPKNDSQVPTEATNTTLAQKAPGFAVTNTTRKPLRPNLFRKTTAAGSVVYEPSNIGWLDQMHMVTTVRPYIAQRDCGSQPMRRAGRVVGGRDSYMGEFPWSVLIKETSLLGFFVKTKCGGVLIDLKWVLTAAHCQPGMFGSLIAVVGESDSTIRTGKLKPVVRKVKRMIIHRDYNPSNFDNDIALLELESPYQLQPHVVPICLPERDEEFIGQHAMVAGWGKLSFGGPVPNVLQVAKLPVIDNKQCQNMYLNSGHVKIISDSFLCAGYATGGQDSCEGDSGGPLQAQRSNSKWVLVGTVSHGIKCAEPNLPGIYIKTAAYLPWIKAVTYQQDYNKRYGHRLFDRSN